MVRLSRDSASTELGRTMKQQLHLGVVPSAADERWTCSAKRFSICTLVTDWEQYKTMVESFASHGFVGEDCEYLYLDNTRANRFDAYRGLNTFLGVAQGEYVVLCHQDVELLEDGRAKLDAAIASVEAIDADWGLLGNAGGLPNGTIVRRITDSTGTDDGRGLPYPIRVVTVDENFMVARRVANLAVSGDMNGFHMYGTDLALVAERLGYGTYVVDFHLIHHGKGTLDENFFRLRRELQVKLARLSRWRWVVTTCTQFAVVGMHLLDRWAQGHDKERFLKTLIKLRRWGAVLLGWEARGQSRK
jgi:hypothetical protein